MKEDLHRENGMLDIDGVALEYLWLGPSPGDAPTLILLHEGLGCVSLWKDFPERLARATGLGVMAYSRAGYGRSDSSPLPRPLSFMHTEGMSTLSRVLDAADIRETVLVGHSDGASIALIHAGGAGNARVKGLALMAPHVIVEEVTLAGIRAAREDYVKTDLRHHLARHHGENVDCAFWGWNGVWLNPEFRQWNLEGFLPPIRVPVLLIQGEEDNFGTVLQLETIERALSEQAEVLMLPDCGHSPFRDQPEATLGAISTFVARCLSREIKIL
jgi:pimeloyl-ACP methyl ester carboxylesterase